MSAHARLSCSGAARWMACPGSVAFEARFPESSSAAAAEGTVAHDLLEVALVLGIDAVNALGTVEGSSFEMAEHVQTALDWIRGELAARPGAKVLVEERLDPGASIDREDLWGTGDVVILDRERAEILVIDLKFGMGIVEVAETPQLPLYALGAWRLAYEMDEDFPVRSFKLVIAQPRAPHRDGPIRSVVRTPEELDDFAIEVRAAAARTDDPNAPLVAGDHCGFCRAAGACPAFAEHALRAAEAEFADLEPDAPIREPLTPERISELLREAERVKAWARAVEAYALRIAQDGIRLPGWNLIRKRGRRAWLDPDAALASLLETYGVDPDVLAPRVLKSPRQIEQAIKAAKLGKADLSALVAIPDIGWRLAPDTAPGDEFLDAETEFADVRFDP